MRIKLEYRGTVFEYERRPLAEGHFRALCALAAAGVYAGRVAAVAALCGLSGLLAVVVGTVIVAAIASV